MQPNRCIMHSLLLDCQGFYHSINKKDRDGCSNYLTTLRIICDDYGFSNMLLLCDMARSILDFFCWDQLRYLAIDMLVEWLVIRNALSSQWEDYR